MTLASLRFEAYTTYNVFISPPPFPVEELLQKLQDLHSAISQGKDSL